MSDENNMPVYTLDSTLAMIILISSTFLVAALTVNCQYRYYSPEVELAELLMEPCFVSAIYSGDIKTIEAYLNSFFNKPYNLTVFSIQGEVVLTVGYNIEGYSAVAVLPGWGGVNEKLIVTLRVGA